ncbi:MULTISPECIES: hypothetical protein [unclassified Rhodococcus (in: high G+C Gram-positive bacteria)]|uniref:hypothetical protein n=1 Tax=unclassified Rhodococcus (in: high G+C Gram-positive bacteria) TaxID=192944 RepID=UPI000AA450BF|nr:MULTISPECIES: hypothetical protein [unclassified Rhodococcus (in: high G+C Gram-positive bacteria)]QXU53645.1 hypothetical protein KXC42_23460 [Rhodococcus sp. LW-XY12]
MTDDPHAKYRVTDSVPVASAILSAAANVPPVVRLCSVCDEQLPAGVVKHVQCRAWTA